MPDTTSGAWRLQEVRDQIIKGNWVFQKNLNSPGTLWGMGCNNAGRIGDETVISRSSPVQIPGTQWTKLTIRCTSFAFKDDGTLWGWGDGLYGQLGPGVGMGGGTGCRSSPIQIPGNWSTITSAGTYVMGIKTDGTLWGWGRGSYGALGDNNSDPYYSSPIQIPGTQWCFIVGDEQTFGIKTDGTLWAWGFDGTGFGEGQLGQNATNVPRSSPVQIPGTQWTSVTNGVAFSLATKSDGTLWAWGSNVLGALGVGDTVHRSSPTQVPGTTWRDVKSGRYHTLATKTDGTLWSWGYNFHGTIGNNTSSGLPSPSSGYSSPVQIPGNTWWYISAASSSFATKTDGSLWVWGQNWIGEAGLNDSNSRSSPTQVPGTNWLVACSETVQVTLARKY